MYYTVTENDTGKVLTTDEILAEVNRDRSDDWSDYDEQDLLDNPEGVLGWIGNDYYTVNISSL